MTDQNSKQDVKPREPAGRKLLIEMGPLIVFFLGFKFGDMMVATGAFMASMVLSMGASYYYTKHISPMLKITFVIVMVMGSLTLILQDETFVKMKLTIINTVLGVVLAFGLLRGKAYLKTVMEMALEMSDAGWHLFTRNYMIFLFAMAGINEFIWRTQTTDFWVNFKTFGYMGIMMVFLFGQLMYLFSKKYIELPEESTEEAEK